MVVGGMKITIKGKLGHYFKITHVPNTIHTCISSYFSSLIFQLSIPLPVGRPSVFDLHFLYMFFSSYLARYLGRQP